MKFRCYKDGDDRARGLYDGTPADAAQAFVGEWNDDERRVNVVVEPLDDEARALPGWHRDAESAAFKMFVVVAHVRFEATEVETFNPFAPKVA